MRSRLISFRTAGLVTLFVVTLSAVAAAQRPSGAGAPAASHPQPSTKAAPQATNHPAGGPADINKGEPKNFTGAAKQLGTTADALDAAYKTALAANPKLTRGQFIAANMLAKNLSGKNAGITTQAILDGLASGKSIGQTLQGLGLSADEASSAEAEANRQARGESESHKPSK